MKISYVLLIALIFSVSIIYALQARIDTYRAFYTNKHIDKLRLYKDSLDKHYTIEINNDYFADYQSERQVIKALNNYPKVGQK